MSGNSFKVGDIVTLKSGGPKMTIMNFESRDSNPLGNELKADYVGGFVHTVWHDTNGKVYQGVFAPAVLDGGSAPSAKAAPAPAYGQSPADKAAADKANAEAAERAKAARASL